ncbi:hypothetical protein HYT45_01155 [Candidatus Uhrbacteria bacterium]|nr:hypothetical protein [Candidatus Uhrbacteria bacterium]
MLKSTKALVKALVRWLLIVICGTVLVVVGGGYLFTPRIDAHLPLRTAETFGYTDPGFVAGGSFGSAYSGCGAGEAAFDMRATNPAGRRVTVLACCRSGGWLVGQASCEIRGK